MAEKIPANAAVESFRRGTETYFEIIAERLNKSDRRDQDHQLKEQWHIILPSMLNDPDTYSDGVLEEVARGNFSSLNPTGLIVIMNYLGSSADGLLNYRPAHDNSPGQLVESVNDRLALKYPTEGRWI